MEKINPEPCKWTITEHGIVPHYDFIYYKKSNPPPDNWETPVIHIHTGYFKNRCWIAR